MIAAIYVRIPVATLCYREMDMRFWLEQAVVIVDGLGWPSVASGT